MTAAHNFNSNYTVGGKNYKILVVEDDLSNAEMLKELLTSEGYAVVQEFDGPRVLRAALREKPDLILLDILLPGLNGFEALKQIREQPQLNHIPVFMLTALDTTEDKTHAFSLLANDYICKTTHPKELLARIRSQLIRSQQEYLIPLTHLPGEQQIHNAIELLMKKAQPWTLLYIDLDNFKALNDAYGFDRGNKMILKLAEIIKNADKNFGAPEDFLGHIGGEDFLLLTAPECIVVLCEEIIRKFAAESVEFYRPEDIASGGFQAKDRSGKLKIFPIVTVSIAALNSTDIPSGAVYEDISEKIAHLKNIAKSVVGNSYTISSDSIPIVVN